MERKNKPRSPTHFLLVTLPYIFNSGQDCYHSIAKPNLLLQVNFNMPGIGLQMIVICVILPVHIYLCDWQDQILRCHTKPCQTGMTVNYHTPNRKDQSTIFLFS